MSTPPTTRRGAAIAAAIVAAVLIAGAVVLAITLGDDDAGGAPWLPAADKSADSVIPARLSRVEVMERYAEIAPLDSSATPEAVDKLAGLICGRLGQGTSTDTIITDMTEHYQARATQVTRLLVEYLCPQYLKDFR